MIEDAAHHPLFQEPDQFLEAIDQVVPDPGLSDGGRQ